MGKLTFIVFVKCQDISQEFEVIVSEQSQGYEETYKFETKMVLGKEELA